MIYIFYSLQNAISSYYLIILLRTIKNTQAFLPRRVRGTFLTVRLRSAGGSY